MQHFWWYIASLAAGLLPFAIASEPLVTLPYGSFQGNTSRSVTSFLGMPYAQPPLGNLRFAPPQAPEAFDGVRLATSYGAACLQQTGSPPQGLTIKLSSLADVSEDCLFVNVLTPAAVNTSNKLPVLFWVYGGAFVEGSSASNPGNIIVERSITLGEPIIFVSFNYRLNAFGFLASEEVENAGLTNIGMRDQRFAMEWVNKYISSFGGDPDKVTIWGESAGAFAVGLQMIMNNGDAQGLFRAAIMESGSAYALRNVSAAQGYYDLLVNYTGCSGQADTLACLREAPAEQIVEAVNLTPTTFNYTGHNLAWQPRLDRDLFVRNPQHSLLMGLYTKVPIISGDCDDEGTLFSLGNLNITTDEEFLQYIGSNYIPGATPAEIAAVGAAYPDNPSLGSPFGTGDADVLTPQFKRIAAFTGDWQFEAPRRLTLSVISQTQDAWAYLFKRGKSTPYLGAYHSSDLSEFFTDIDYIGTDALINFVTNLDPNAPAGLPANVSYLSGIQWPRWTSGNVSPSLLTFQDPIPTFNFTSDTFRAAPMALLTALSLQMP
ncbi:hypothetical protein POSPLADRAFT_1142177 [Postia placenta MAD-698-R-SB12]|uniref:Carboxylic ester hydrolase n=1 Tax=Postia placenta MAD-698-R-SB12 TaxID=670580 RepID=A0A1X6N270_9APHY|nr:hypothetical protein POSPLADRAFT_1142177 [Postia placenta MAD-698-R-SB12]OSX62566.1 hypothetical protein POSPLADRAFT_1142177 [Postia placenta MAD-698-R-SB12]